MPTTTPPDDSATIMRPEGREPDLVDDLLWQRFSEAKTEKNFYSCWLALLCSMVTDVHGGAVLLSCEAGTPFTPVAFSPKSATLEKYFPLIADRISKKHTAFFLQADAPASPPDAVRQQSIYLACPVNFTGQEKAIVALEISPRTDEQIRAALLQLRWGAGWLEKWLLGEHTKSRSLTHQRLTTLLEASAAALQEKRALAAATVAATELAVRLKCDRVSIGFMENNRLRVAALSHSGEIAQQSNLVSAVEEAMEEAVDQRVSLVFPESSRAGHAILRAHGELAARFASKAILTVPFFDEKGESCGAFTFERAASLPFEEKSVEVCEAAAAFVGAILHEKKCNDRPLARKLIESLRAQIAGFAGPGYAGLRFCLCCLAGFVLFSSLMTGEYRVAARTSLEGTVQRVVIAPFDGFLDKAFFRAGDVVQKDQVLARLDTRDFTLERMNWASRVQQRTLEYHKAMAEDDIALSNIIQEQIRQVEAQLALLDENLSRAQVRVPFDGYVISGDLSQAIGAPLERGQVLFEIAPLNSYRVMLEVDEKDIARIAVGQGGELVLNALPEKTFGFTVKKITPVSRTREGRNFFLVEATLAKQSDRLRPGMHGYGKIVAGRRALIWLWTHELTDRLRLWFWSTIL